MTGGGQVDYYAVLGVPRDASAPDIRRAYRRVARRHHPDLNRDPLGPELFAAAARAYEVYSVIQPPGRDTTSVPFRIPFRSVDHRRDLVYRRRAGCVECSS